MHTPGKGMSGSALPFKRSAPSWLKVTSQEITDLIAKVRERSLLPPQAPSPRERARARERDARARARPDADAVRGARPGEIARRSRLGREGEARRTLRASFFSLLRVRLARAPRPRGG